MVHLAEFGLRLELHGYKYRFSAKKYDDFGQRGFSKA
jgi:hypothetical protein